MRRTLIILALLTAGPLGRAVAATPEPGHSIAPAAAGSTAALGSSVSGAGGPWLAGHEPGPAPRRLQRPSTESGVGTLGSDAAFSARATGADEYLASLALARAGLPAVHSTAPPPFPSV